MDSIDFGSHLVGITTTQSVVVVNGGSIPLNFVSLGTTAAPYSINAGASTCSNVTPLGVRQNCTIALNFKPSGAVLSPGSFALDTDSVPAPDPIALSGMGLAGTQKLKNSSFEMDANLDRKPDKWTFSNFDAATDGRDCTVHKSGICSLLLVGNGTQKTATQTVKQSGTAGDEFSFTLWSKSQSVPAGATYQLQVKLYDGPALLATSKKNFTKGTHGFQKVNSAFVAPGAYTKVTYKLTFKGPSGMVWFDAAGLSRVP